MASNDVIKHVILQLINGNEEDQEIYATAVHCSVSSNLLITNTLLSLANSVVENDVYVGSYFEEVVPRYSEATYKTHFRMSRTCMQNLINDLQVILNETRNIDKMLVPLEKKVHVTIWLLANHAISFRATSDLFGLSKGTTHLIFIEICRAICDLKEKYIKWPNLNESTSHANKIENRTKFPGVVGMIDGCHIPIKAPVDNAFDFYNRKQFYSVVLQGVCDENLKFINIYLGMTGKVHDARIFRVSPLSTRIDEGLLPPEFHLLGDSAYPLGMALLTPYRDNGHLNNVQKNFNKTHAGLRSAIERSFGLLKNKFRRLQYLDMSLTAEITNVIAACCTLHNFILHHDGLAGYENLDEQQAQQAAAPHDALYRNRRAEIKRNNIAENL